MKEHGRAKFTLETIASVQDAPKGNLANSLENDMMTRYRTYWPDFGDGYNFKKETLDGTYTEERWAAHSAALSASLSRPEIREKMRNSHLGKKLTPEHVAKMSARLVGNKFGVGNKNALGNKSRTGKPHSLESRIKMRRKHTPEETAKSAGARRGAVRTPEQRARIKVGILRVLAVDKGAKIVVPGRE